MTAEPVSRLAHEELIDSTLAPYQDDKPFRYLVESAADGIIINQDDRFVYANPKALAQFGVESLIELARYQVLDFIAPDDRPKMRAFNHELIEQGGFSGPEGFRRQKRDGTVIEVVAVATKISWNGRPALLGIIRNATQQERIQMTLEANAERLSGFLSVAATWLWETDAEHRFIFLSDGPDVSAFRPEQVLGLTRWELANAMPDSNARWREHLADLDARRPFREFEYRAVSPNGDEIHRSISGMPIFDADGTFKGYRGIARDITERRKAQLEMQHMALHDSLTALPNRRYFEEALRCACVSAGRQHAKFAVLFLDIDHFKDINDVFGHSVGDLLLAEVAERLRRCVSTNGIVARFAGDEFVIIEPALPNKAAAVLRAEKICDALQPPMELDGQVIQIRASVGIAIFPEHASSAANLLKNADIALYRAKLECNRHWQLFHKGMSSELKRRCTLQQDLWSALPRRELALVYQPLIDLESKQIVGVEALVRWRHPVHGTLAPKRFIPIAEGSGLISQLGLWIMREACHQARKWRLANHNLRVAINLSPVQLRQAEFLAQVEQILVETQVEGSWLEFELTENTLIETAGRQTKVTLERLAGLGIQISIDDFGSGYSSLAYLKRLPVQRIKVDRAFVKDIGRHSDDEAIVKAIIGLGHSLGKSVTAEGVETAAQVAFLEGQSCDEAQGFYFGRPRPAGSIDQLLTMSTRTPFLDKASFIEVLPKSIR